MFCFGVHSRSPDQQRTSKLFGLGGLGFESVPLGSLVNPGPSFGPFPG